MTNLIDVNPVEDASAELFTAAIMCDVTERSLNGVRAWLRAMGRDPATIHEIMEIDVMLFAIKDRINDAKATIDKFVSDTFDASRPTEAA